MKATCNAVASRLRRTGLHPTHHGFPSPRSRCASAVASVNPSFRDSSYARNPNGGEMTSEPLVVRPEQRVAPAEHPTAAIYREQAFADEGRVPRPRPSRARRGVPRFRRRSRGHCRAAHVAVRAGTRASHLHRIFATSRGSGVARSARSQVVRGRTPRLRTGRRLRERS